MSSSLAFRVAGEVVSGSFWKGAVLGMKRWILSALMVLVVAGAVPVSALSAEAEEGLAVIRQRIAGLTVVTGPTPIGDRVLEDEEESLDLKGSSDPAVPSEHLSWPSLPLDEVVAQARSGWAPAQFELGRRVRSGIGCRPDAREALLWLSSSARQGFFPAGRELGLLLSTGARGVPRDKVTGYAWLLLAAQNAQATAEESQAVMRDRDTLAATLSIQEMRRGRDLAAHWAATGPVSDPPVKFPALSSGSPDGKAVAADYRPGAQLSAALRRVRAVWSRVVWQNHENNLLAAAPAATDVVRPPTTKVPAVPRAQAPSRRASPPSIPARATRQEPAGELAGDVVAPSPSTVPLDEALERYRRLIARSQPSRPVAPPAVDETNSETGGGDPPLSGLADRSLGTQDLDRQVAAGSELLQRLQDIKAQREADRVRRGLPHIDESAKLAGRPEEYSPAAVIATPPAVLNEELQRYEFKMPSDYRIIFH
jgi:hypothetical protein